MNTGSLTPGFAYLRLSNEEAQGGESSSITNQRRIVRDFCVQHGIAIVREFVDDGWSGGNFDRPGFQEMMRRLEAGQASTVVTKDLSRLGRDMREASYYAEQFFPEHGIRYLAIADNFDTERENIMAPFQFAMNEVYLRDGSRKVRDVLKSKRESGLYCACPPYGYRKDAENPGRLVPDEATAPIVRRIYERAAAGDSSRRIALDLNADGAIPPLKYRVLFRDEFSEAGASHASDLWNYTTVKRILKNPVYLGHTLLGRTRKASVKSRRKLPVPREQWAVTEHTHEPLVSEALSRRAQLNLGRGTRAAEAGGAVRKSIFSGIAVCGLCGHALCSGGTVYRGEREKYWYLSCTHRRRGIPNPCPGVRIRYADLVELVRRDLNELLSLTDGEAASMAREAARRAGGGDDARRAQREKARVRLLTIDRVAAKLYTDNAEGRLDDERLRRMIAELERESSGLQAVLSEPAAGQPAEGAYERFFALARRYGRIDALDRETLETFVERVEVGPRDTSGPNGPRQRVRIVYRFIGERPESAL